MIMILVLSFVVLVVVCSLPFLVGLVDCWI